MKRHYDGLDAVEVPIGGPSILTISFRCVGIITLKFEHGICVSDPDFQEIEYFGKDDPNW